MRRTQGIACALTAVLTAASAQATFVHFDFNAISVSAGEAFGGTDHTGSLELSSSAGSALSAIEIDGESQAVTGDLGSLTGEIVLSGGAVAGGWIRFQDETGAEYYALIGDTAGSVNTQAGNGFRIDGLTSDGAFMDLDAGNQFAGVDLFAGEQFFGEPLMLDGSFLLHGFGPGESGFDGLVDLDVYASIDVPSPGPAALAMAAFGISGTRRRR